MGLDLALWADGVICDYNYVFDPNVHLKRFFGENIEYGITCRNMYWVYKRLGKRNEAIEALEKARESFAQVLGEDDDRTCAIADDLRRLKEGSGT